MARRQSTRASVPAVSDKAPEVEARRGVMSRMSSWFQAHMPVATPFEAASRNKRIPEVGMSGPVDSARYFARMTKLSRYLYHNDGWVRRGVNVLATNVVGTGPIPKPPFPEMAELFSAFMRECDPDAIHSLGSMLKAGYVAESVDGEVEWSILPCSLDEGLTIPLQVRLIEMDHIPLTLNRNDGPDERVVNGVVLRIVNGKWKHVGFYVYPEHPGDATLRLVEPTMTPVFVSKRDMLQQWKPHRPSARRGMTKAVAAIVRALNLNAYQGAEESRKLTQTLFAGFIKKTGAGKPLLPGAVQQKEDEDAWANLRFEPGTIAALPSDTEITFSDPKDTGQSYESYMRFGILYLAACFDISYEQLSGDWRGASDRTWRAAQVDLRKIVDEERARLERQVLNHLYRRVVDLAIQLGLWVPPPGLPPHKLYEIRWSWPAHANPNQYQEYNAMGGAEDRGFVDHDTAVEMLGGDPVQIDIRNAIARARRKALDGLTYKFDLNGQGAPGGFAAQIEGLISGLLKQELDRREQSELGSQAAGDDPDEA